eukprot:COSAG01_NODE_5867_length_3982_cov_7.929178_6_plen_319_part_00
MSLTPKGGTLGSGAVDTSAASPAASLAAAAAAPKALCGPTAPADPRVVAEIAEIRQIYSTHSPKSDEDVARILASFRGREAQLLQKVRKKYTAKVQPRRVSPATLHSRRAAAKAAGAGTDRGGAPCFERTDTRSVQPRGTIANYRADGSVSTVNVEIGPAGAELGFDLVNAEGGAVADYPLEWEPRIANLLGRFPAAGRACVVAQLRGTDGHAGRATAALEAMTMSDAEKLAKEVSQNGWLLSRRGCSLPASAGGLDTHRDSMTSRFDRRNGGRSSARPRRRGRPSARRGRCGCVPTRWSTQRLPGSRHMGRRAAWRR